MGGRFLACVLIMVTVSLSGCSVLSTHKDKDQVEGTLTVLYYNETLFAEDYGKRLKAEFPELEVKVVPTEDLMTQGSGYIPSILERIDKEKPDLFGLWSPLFDELANSNKLYDLDLLEGVGDVAQSFDSEFMAWIRGKAAGKLYGLPPAFQSMVLYYNKDIFDRYRVEYPRDRMSWEDVMQLANQIYSRSDPKSPVYGYAHYGDELYPLIETIGQTVSLNAVDARGKNVTIDSESWRKVFELVLNAYQTGGIYRPPERQDGNTASDSVSSHPFIQGKAAMAFGGSYLIPMLEQSWNSPSEQQLAKNWAVVTAPVDPRNPNRTFFASPSTLFAIRADTPNQSLAAAVLKYIVSENAIRSKSLTRDSMPIREDLLRDNDNRHLSSFYELTPADPPVRNAPDRFYATMSSLAEDAIQQVLQNKMSLDEALDRLQKNAQEQLDLANAQDR
ncbi:ABC transporter substrate-binding protein [Cohnella faecalis]|uniref:Extracellular solute-binding protein n=1 Tax=Cohnella faecalis TaxID=2315694 RepID=A0A398D2D7_9BACL|nr:extracellular solute-binding protein [Cohnella faecalis]RIE05234.1 extracellular solute-binding protein [Cohnella faecalis]